jgi:pyruvate/2-oxoacid:ferredoxin oxidoreductase alpha subunit
MPVEVISGNAAQAAAARLARVQVVAAYPITPQTTIVEAIAEDVAAGRLAAQFLPVESEHSALQACVSASALGARTYTATSSQGLLLMHELLHWAAGLRAPVVMGVVNRAVAPPWSIGADHTDTIAQRDTGWIQLYAESNQEVLDSVLIAYRVAEDAAVRLPVMIAEDAFYLSHTFEPVDVPDEAAVDRFLPPRAPHATLVSGVAGRLGSFTGPVEYVRFRHAVAEAEERVLPTLAAVEEEYARITGRHHGGALVAYRTDDAEAVLLTMGTAASTARVVVDRLRREGLPVGTAKLRLFRPFPTEAVAALARGVRHLGVLDRSFTFGPYGAVATEVRAALFGRAEMPAVAGFVGGIGGRDVTPKMLESIFRSLLGDAPAPLRWMDLEGEVAADG